jgi:hypothetical protein
MHHTCIKNYDLKRNFPKKQHVLRLVTNSEGNLTVQYAGMRDNPNLIATSQEVTKNVKRTRDLISKDDEP